MSSIFGMKTKIPMKNKSLIQNMLRWISFLLLSICGEIYAEDRVLQDIQFITLPGNQIQIILTLSSAPLEPKSFSTANPARIAIDLQETHIGLKQRYQKVEVGAVQGIAVVESGDRTRVILNLVQPLSHEIRVDGNQIQVTLGGTKISESQKPPPKMTQLSPRNDPSPRKTTVHSSVEDVDFRRGESGEGRIIITFSNSKINADVRQQGNNIVVDFQGAYLPPALRRRLDVMDFGTPVHNVDSLLHDGNAQMVIANSDDFEHLTYQSDKTFTIEIRPLTKEQQETAKKERFGFTGEKISFNLQNIEIRALLHLIAEFTKRNIVVSDSVQGSITLRLDLVPWDQALDIVLKSRNLGRRDVGEVIMIAPNDEISAREKQELEAKKVVTELAPLRSEMIQINYAKASEISSFLKAKENSLLSQRGNVSVDERTNTLLIQETAEKLSEIRHLITTLDVAVRQVLIESRIVIADDTFAKDLGVRFGVNGVAQQGGYVGAVSGSLNGTDAIVNSAITNLSTTGSPFPVTVPAISDRLNTSVPSSGRNGGIAFALLGSRYLLDLELSALQTEHRGEVLSNPRIITSNQKEATIEQGEEIPYQAAAGGASGGTSVSFKKAALVLKVKPQITPDDRIILTIDVNKDSRGQLAGGQPAINTKKISTEVLIDNGETLVLGGIYEQTVSNDVSRVPFFGDIPILGALFRSNSNVNYKSELLIFVTPRIIKQNMSVK
ncbi:type IV pilus assembly protein PilQ [Gammaproteobacteria bacterium]